MRVSSLCLLSLALVGCTKGFSPTNILSPSTNLNHPQIQVTPTPTPAANSDLASSQSCNVKHGKGIQVISQGTLGPCVVTSCDTGFRVEDSLCAPDLVINSIRKEFNIQSRTFPWGYHQTKIVRKGDSVYLIYPTDSADCDGARNFPVGKTTLFKKAGDGQWIAGSTFPFTSGGLLVTPDGYPRPFGYWDGTSACTPNIGNGGVSIYNSYGSGDIVNFAQEWVQPPPPAGASSNIVTGRTGAAVDLNGNIIFSEAVPDEVNSWVKMPGGVFQRVQMLANPGSWFPYPFVQPLRSGFWVTFANNATSHNGNLMMYPNGNWTWSPHIVSDFRGDSSQNFGVDQSDVLEDSQGRLHELHVYVKDGKKYFDHLVFPMGNVTPSAATFYASDSTPVTYNFIYLRMVEVSQKIFYIGVENNQIWFKEATKAGAAPDYGWSKLKIPDSIMAGGLLHTVQTFVSAPRGGGDPVSKFVDVLAINGTSDVDNGLALYIRIPAEVLLATD